mgnify:CR=1 FL=1
MKNIANLIIMINLIFSLSYYSDIQIIFNQNECAECHIGNQASAGLRLTSYEEVINSGIVVPGNHQSSLLWLSVQDGWMPPYTLPDLSDENVNIIADWIDQGARVCDEGYLYLPEIADGVEEEYFNVNIQDQEYNPCFWENDVIALQDIISVNEFENITDPFKLGTQTWNTGRLRFLVAGYYFSGVEEIIHTLPESFGQLDDLRSLYLEWNQIESLPESFTNLNKLVNLYISNNKLTNLPEDFGNLENLFILDLGYNEINSVPSSILNLDILTYLWIFNNNITELPSNFCDLDLNWNDDDTFGYPYFAIGGNMLCENVPDCVMNSTHFNTSLEQYYYSVQITVEQDCSWLNNISDDDFDFSINNIFPNPFNPAARINFTTKSNEKINIVIYDLYGNKIKTLLNDKLLQTGNHSIIWNAKEIPSGIYFINISNEKISLSEKIILQK